MSEKRTVAVSELGEALRRELTIWREDVVERVNAAGRDSMNTLVAMTKKTAPRSVGGSDSSGKRTRKKHYRSSIASAETEAGHGCQRFTWYVKAPAYRLTHLLVHGHATKNGGRTRANPFLRNALDAVLPEYERRVREAIGK